MESDGSASTIAMGRGTPELSRRNDIKKAVAPFSELLLRYTNDMDGQITLAQLTKEWDLLACTEHASLQHPSTVKDVLTALLETMQEKCISDGSEEEERHNDRVAGLPPPCPISARHDSVLSCESEYLEDDDDDDASRSSSPVTTSPTCPGHTCFSPERLPKKSSLMKGGRSTLFACLSNSSNSTAELFMAERFEEGDNAGNLNASGAMSRNSSLICSGSGSSAGQWDGDRPPIATQAQRDIDEQETSRNDTEAASPAATSITANGSIMSGSGSAAAESPTSASPMSKPPGGRRNRRVSFIACMKEDRTRRTFPSTPIAAVASGDAHDEPSPLGMSRLSPTASRVTEGMGLSLLGQAGNPPTSFTGGRLLAQLATANKSERDEGVAGSGVSSPPDALSASMQTEAQDESDRPANHSFSLDRPPVRPPPLAREPGSIPKGVRSNSVASSAGCSDYTAMTNDKDESLNDSDECLGHTVTETKEVRKETDDLGNKYINNYAVVGEIGRGSFGKVKKVHHIDTGRPYAIKVLNKSVLRRKSHQALYLARQEVAILKKLRHRNIVSLYEVIDDEESNKMYMVLEYAGGGCALDFDHNGEVTNEGLSMETARKYFRDLVSALKYSHANNIIHRDIKPENLLLDDEGNLKLSDFGVSAMVDEDDWTLHDLEGTPAFQPPEALDPQKAKKGVDGKKLDMWALGVTLFTFVYGRLPFFGETRVAMVRHILNMNPEFEELSRSGEEVDDECIECMQQLMAKDPEERIEMERLLQNLWVSPPSDFTEVPLTPLHHSGRTTDCITPGYTFGDPERCPVTDSFSIGSPTIATSPHGGSRRFSRNGTNNSDTPPTPTKGGGRRARSKSVVQVTKEEVENSILKGRRISLLEKVAMSRRMSFKGIGIGLRNQSFTLVPEIYSKGLNVVGLSAAVACIGIVERISSLRQYTQDASRMLRVTIESHTQTDPAPQSSQGLSMSLSSLTADGEQEGVSNTSFSKARPDNCNSPDDFDKSWSNPLATSILRFNNTVSGPLERASTNPAVMSGSGGLGCPGTPKSPSLSKTRMTLQSLTDDAREDYLASSHTAGSPSRTARYLPFMSSPKRPRTKTVVDPSSPTSLFRMPASPQPLLEPPGSPKPLQQQGGGTDGGQAADKPPPSYAEASASPTFPSATAAEGSSSSSAVTPKCPADISSVSPKGRRKRAQTTVIKTSSFAQ